MLYPVATTPLLNELHGGEFTGMDRESFRAKYPEMWEEREQDKLEFRFPGTGGESYQDVIQRVRPIIVELERQVRGKRDTGAEVAFSLTLYSERRRWRVGGGALSLNSGAAAFFSRLDAVKLIATPSPTKFFVFPTHPPCCGKFGA